MMAAPMAMLIAILAIVISTLLTGSHCAKWSSDLQEGATIYVCEGQELTFPWGITPDTGEYIMDITWYYVGDQTEKMIAVYSYNILFTLPSYFSRVKHVSSAGLVLSNVTQADGGNYKVKVMVHRTGGTLLTYNRTAVMHVATESTARIDATMVVKQNPAAAHDNNTGQFHVQLTCTSRGRKPPAVIWKTPSQQTLSSSGVVSDTFSLLLPNPVSGGNYTCRVPPDSPVARCLPRDDPALEGAKVFVDDVKARITVMETEVHSLKDVHSKQVVFHARLSSGQQLTSGIIKPYGYVTVNQGNAFNRSTGEFIVPYSGHYYFTATTAGGTYSTSTSYYSNLYLIVGGSYMSYIDTKSVNYVEMGTCSYAGRLDKGQKVWLMGSGYFHGTLTTFSGFLVYAD